MKNEDRRRDQAIKNALASTRMEGYTITPENERDIRRIVSGEISTTELFAKIKEKHAAKRVR